MTHHTPRRPMRAVALAGAGALAACLALGGLAQANGASTSEHPAAQGIVWLDDLLHPLDISDAFRVFGAITSRVGPGDGPYGLSACTGDTRMSDVVGSDVNLFFGIFHGKDGEDGNVFAMPEHVADQATAVRAATTYNTIVSQVRACQHEPAGHWHYGIVHQVNTSVGVATWMVTFEGDGTRSGGVIVARVGRHLAVVEADGAGTFHQLQQLVAGTMAQLR